MHADQPLRVIKSFVKRQGRMTKAQEAALAKWLPTHSFSTAVGALKFEQIFGNSNPVVLEIGFGMGASLLALAGANPQVNYIGVEVHAPGVGALLAGMAEMELNNIRVSCQDANEVLQQNIPENSLAGVQIFFPDPWPKKRHHKRRLIQSAFMDKLIAKLQPEGYLHLATDWSEYAEWMLAVCQEQGQLKNQAQDQGFIERPASRPVTKYEARGTKLGHSVYDLLYVKK